MARLVSGAVKSGFDFCALKFYRVMHGAFKFSPPYKARKFGRFCKASQILARRRRGFKFKRKPSANGAKK